MNCHFCHGFPVWTMMMERGHVLVLLTPKERPWRRRRRRRQRRGRRRGVGGGRWRRRSNFIHAISRSPLRALIPHAPSHRHDLPAPLPCPFPSLSRHSSFFSKSIHPRTHRLEMCPFSHPSRKKKKQRREVEAESALNQNEALFCYICMAFLYGTEVKVRNRLVISF